MAASKTKILLRTNNENIKHVLLNHDFHPSVEFAISSSKAPYCLFLIDLDSDQSNITNQLIDTYSFCREKKIKLAVCLLFDQKVDNDKLVYFSRMVTEMANGHPIHRLILTRDIYQDFVSSPISYFEKQVSKVFEKNSISVSSKGNNYFYPTHIKDLLNGIFHALFGNKTEGNTYWMAGEPIKDLDLAFLIKSLTSDSGNQFQIDSTQANEEKDNSFIERVRKTQIELNWRPIEDFESGLRLLYKNFLSNPHSSQDFESHGLKKRKISSRWLSKIFKKIVRKNLPFNSKQELQTVKQLAIEKAKKITLSLLGLATLTIILSGSLACLFALVSFRQLESASAFLKVGDLHQAVIATKSTHIYEDLSQTFYSPVKAVVRVINPQIPSEIDNVFLFLRLSTETLDSLEQTISLAEKVFAGLTSNGKEVNIGDTSLALESNLISIHEKISQLDIMLKEKRIPKSIDAKIKSNKYLKNLVVFENQISHAIKIVSIIPDVLEGDSTKNILILVQNNHEIRGSGGIIQYIIHLQIDKGKLTANKIYESSELDSMLIEPLPAPKTLQQYLGTENWNITDMGFDPDFSQVSRVISWSFAKATGITPDFITSVNNSLFENLITEEGVVIDGKSLIANEVPQLLDTDSSIYKKIVTNFVDRFSSGKINLIKFGRSIATELESGNILLWSKDENTEQKLISTTYSGTVSARECHPLLGSASCLSETTHLNESNLSVAPLNRIINRRIDHQIILGSGVLEHTYKLNYHFSEKIATLNRDYLAVYQIYVPKDSILSNVDVDGVASNISMIEKEFRNDLGYYQIPVNLSLNNDHEVLIKFSTNTDIFLKQTNPTLTFTEIRQSGSGSLVSFLSIKPPVNYQVATITSPVINQPEWLGLELPTQTFSFGLSLKVRSQ